MRSELSIAGFTLNMRSRSRRRALVVGVYLVLVAILSAVVLWAPWTLENSSLFFLLVFLINRVAFGGLTARGLVHPSLPVYAPFGSVMIRHQLRSLIVGSGVVLLREKIYRQTSATTGVGTGHTISPIAFFAFSHCLYGDCLRPCEMDPYSARAVCHSISLLRLQSPRQC
jgi:hypothetical protein